MQPTVRAGLLVESTADEVVVVDEQTNEVFSLDRVAACVFTHADGSRSVTDLVAELRVSVDPDATSELVWSTLDRLADAGLLVERVTPPGGISQLNRRSLLVKGAAGTAAVGAGVIFTSLIPDAAAAVSGPQSEQQDKELGDKAGEQGAKEGTAKGEQQGKETGQKLGEQAGKEGAVKGEVQSKEQLAKNP